MPSAPTTVRIPIRPPQAVHEVSARWWLPHAPVSEAIVILAHGAGSRLDHPLHVDVCAAVAAAGCRTLAFNFGYAEAGRRGPDPMPRLLAAFHDVVAWVRDAHPQAPIVVGGRSMGGRVASLLVADGLPCAGLVLLNYPLVGINRRAQSQPRVDHWPKLTGPVLFVHGTRDRLLDEAVFADHRDLLDNADVTVSTVPEADHGFRIPKRTGREAGEVIADVGATVARWVSAIPAAAAR